jgi:hypothetical protein
MYRRKLVNGPVSQPAPGADWVFSAPGDVYWRLVSLRAQLVTNATAGNRVAHLQLVDQTGNIAWDTVCGNATASGTWTYNLMSSRGSELDNGSPFSNYFGVPFPNAWYPPNWKIKPATTGLLGTDQWENVYATYVIAEELEILDDGEVIEI